MADVALQRKNMVESQVRPSDITDQRIIRAMLDVPRDAYVPLNRAAIAYADTDINLTPTNTGKGSSRALMAPRIFAKLIQLCNIEAHDDVLIVGAGMGYSAAIVARLAKSVTALECDASLAAHAAKALAGIPSVEVVTGPLDTGLPAKAPFDVIVIEGAVAHLPQALFDQLGPNGRLAVIAGHDRAGKAVLWRRHAGGLDATEYFDATARLLPGFAPAQVFRF